MSEKVEDRIKELEERLASTIPNKATQRSINYIKAQLAKLRESLIKIVSSKKGGGGGFGIKKSGDAQVAFIGFPSVGKSSLLNLLTEGDTHSKVAAYDFTTVTAIPGMMDIEDAKIQLIDLPGIILGAATGKGRGKEVLGAVRSAELILIIICFRQDGTINFTDLKNIRNELFNASIRLNTQPPRISIKKQTRGGIHFTSKGHQLMDKNEVKSLINELGLRNAGVYFSEPNNTHTHAENFKYYHNDRQYNVNQFLRGSIRQDSLWSGTAGLRHIPMPSPPHLGIHLHVREYRRFHVLRRPNPLPAD